MRRVYFLGAGPGDPQLLTLRGAELLAASPAVFLLPPFAETFAELLHGKELLDPFAFSFRELCARLEELLAQGDVVFLVPGDGSFYSPFQGVIDWLGERAALVPGVGTVNAASARLGKTLNLPGVCNRVILTSSRVLEEGGEAPTLQELAAPGVTLVLYMNHIPLPELAARLRCGFGKNVPIALLHRLGLPGEEVVVGTLEDIVDKAGERDYFALAGRRPRPSLTLVVAGESLDAAVDGGWWDLRREHFWRRDEKR